jgi:bacterioferritin-associated ferredoxin
MYVCLCNPVTDRQIRLAVDDGARTLGDLRERLGVATCCGKCAGCARSVLREALADTDPGQSTLTPDLLPAPA